MIIKRILFSILSTLLFSCNINSSFVLKKEKKIIENLNKPIKTLDIIGINDLIEIRIYGDNKLTRTYRINNSGVILFPMIGKIKVINKTIFNLTEEIERKLKKNFFKNPQVTIFLKESNSKKVYILGQVKKPGVYNYSHKLTLLKLIATSGGLTNIADIDRIILKREINGKINSITIRASLIIKGLIGDLLLAPEDIIYVSESWL